MSKPILFFDFWGTLFDGDRFVDGMKSVVETVAVSFDLIVVSSASSSTIRTVLEHEGIAGRFVHIIGAEAGRSKADSMRQFPSNGAVMVTDTALDVEAAIAAGVKPIGVAWGLGSREDLRRAGAIVVEKPSDLLEALANV